jgi:hypothetical protein
MVTTIRGLDGPDVGDEFVHPDTRGGTVPASLVISRSAMGAHRRRPRSGRTHETWFVVRRIEVGSW